MTTSHHGCPNCGVPLRWTRQSWADRHPAAAVTAGIITPIFMGMMLSVHPIAALVLLAVTGAVGAAWWVRDARRRREALAARADYENRKWMESSIKWPAPLSPVEVRTPRRRAANHWALTEPMRNAR